MFFRQGPIYVTNREVAISSVDKSVIRQVYVLIFAENFDREIALPQFILITSVF